MTKDSLDYLIKIAIDHPYSKDLLLARKEYQKYTGEIFEDDKSYEDRMALFLEWYIFERIDLSKEQTILESIISNSKEIPASILINIKQFINNIHGLFIVKKIRDTSVQSSIYLTTKNMTFMNHPANYTLAKIIFLKEDYYPMKNHIFSQVIFVFIQMALKNT